MTKPAIIIGGSGRSGTTLLARLVASDPETYGGREESHLFTGAYGLVHYSHLLTDSYSYVVPHSLVAQHRDYLVSRLGRYLTGHVAKYAKPVAVVRDFIHRTVKYAYQGPTVQAGTVCLMASMTRQEADAEVRRFVDAAITNPVEQATGKERWVEKTPWSVLLFPRIATILPDASLVHIHRDPRDVIVSIYKQPWGPSTREQSLDMYEMWLRRWNDISAHTRALPNYTEVSYAHLSEQLGRVDERLGVKHGSHIPIRRVTHQAEWRQWPTPVKEAFQQRVQPLAEKQGFIQW